MSLFSRASSFSGEKEWWCDRRSLRMLWRVGRSFARFSEYSNLSSVGSSSMYLATRLASWLELILKGWLLT